MARASRRSWRWAHPTRPNRTARRTRSRRRSGSARPATVNAKDESHIVVSLVVNAQQERPGRDGLGAFWLFKDGGQGQGRTADLPLFRRTLVPTELPDLRRLPPYAVLTGLEPATSTLTGWRALQTALQDLYVRGTFASPCCSARLAYQLPGGLRPSVIRRARRAPRAPNGIRTRAAALKGRCPRPLDDGGSRLPPCSVTPSVGDP